MDFTQKVYTAFMAELASIATDSVSKEAGLPQAMQRHVTHLPRGATGAVERAIGYSNPAMDAFVKSPGVAARLKQHQLGRDIAKDIARAREMGGIRGALTETANRAISIPLARRGIGG